MSERPVVEKRFNKRLNAMIKRSEQFQDQFQSDDPIRKLLDKFTAFSAEYVELLEKVPAEISRNSFVVNTGIQKLLQEWNVLSRASEQRLIDGLKEELKQASRLANGYCKRWNQIPHGDSYNKLESPVVYFEKLFRISRSIYAPQIPVISIPLSDYDQSENWQALAHEFSHHIFWNGFSADQISGIHEQLRASISTKLSSDGADSTFLGKARFLRQQADRFALWENWLEEVFADVYGTLLVGSTYALSAQDRMAEQVNRVDDFLIADFEHPCVYLRPLVSLYTLELVADQMQDGQKAVEPLKKRWFEFADKASQLKYKEFSMETLAGDLKQVVEIILSGAYWPVPFDPVKQLASPIKEAGATIPLAPIIDQDFRALVFPALASVDLPGTFEDIKKYLVDNSTRFIQALGSQRVDDDAKLLAWLSLAGLELSDTKGYPVHGCTDDHSHLWGFWYGKHTHSQDGSDILSC